MSATNRGRKRNARDSYQTPKYTIESLLDVLDLTDVKSFIEPCKGDGNIYNMVNVPIKDYAEIEEGRDYLEYKPIQEKFDVLITNPPFTYAQEFIDKSLSESDSVWYLLRLNYLGSEKRSEWWYGKEPTHLLVLSARPSFIDGGGTDATEYAWFGWDHSNKCKLERGVHVLPYHKYKIN